MGDRRTVGYLLLLGGGVGGVDVRSIHGCVLGSSFSVELADAQRCTHTLLVFARTSHRFFPMELLKMKAVTVVLGPSEFLVM